MLVTKYELLEDIMIKEKCKIKLKKKEKNYERYVAGHEMEGCEFEGRIVFIENVMGKEKS